MITGRDRAAAIGIVAAIDAVLVGIARHRRRDEPAEDDHGFRFDGRRRVMQASLGTDIQSGALQNRARDTKASGMDLLDTSKSHPAGSKLSHAVARLCQYCSDLSVAVMSPSFVGRLMLDVRLDNNQPSPNPIANQSSGRTALLLRKDDPAPPHLTGYEAPSLGTRDQPAIAALAGIVLDPLDVRLVFASGRRDVRIAGKN